MMDEWKVHQEEVATQEYELIAQLGCHAAIASGLRVEVPLVINEDS